METETRGNTAVAPSVGSGPAKASSTCDPSSSSLSDSLSRFRHVEFPFGFPEDQCHYSQSLKSRRLNTRHITDYFRLEHVISGHSFACEPIPSSDPDATLECPLREEVPFRYDNSLVPIELREPLLSLRHIRLIELYSETADEHESNHVSANCALCCRVYQVSLDDLTTDCQPTFAALSYVCGDQKPVERICCNFEVVGIPRNVYHTLLSLRFKDRSRLIWVDYLCINQNDHLEKSHQVRMLHKIYAQAHVVSWLGHCDDADVHSLTFHLPFLARLWTRQVRKPENDMKSLFDIKCRAKAWLETFFDKNGNGSVPKLTWAVCERIFGAEYFSRLWTIQEITLGKTNSCQIGKAIFSSAFIGAAAHVILGCCELLSSDPSPEHFASMIESVSDVYIEPSIHRRWFRFNEDVASNDMDIATRVSEWTCSDPRDHVYGLSSLIGVPDKYPVDYSLSVSEVFTDFAAHCLLQKGFDTISVRRSTAVSGNQRLNFRSDTPSWCTDLTGKGTGARHDVNWLHHSAYGSDCHAAGSHRLALERPSRSTIIFKGIVVSLVRVCSDIFDRLPSVSPSESVCRSLVWFLESSGTGFWSCLLGCHIDIDYKKALMETMERILFPFDTKCRMFTSKLSFSEHMQSLVDQISPENHLQDLYLPVYLTRVDPELASTAGIQVDSRIPEEDYAEIERATGVSLDFQTSGVRIFATEDNHLGTGLPGVQVGDLLCILYGSRVPQILREVGSTGNYLLVGECYVPGLMYGEGLELGLPEQEFTLI